MRSSRDRARPEAANRALATATALSLGSARDVVTCRPGTPGAPNCAIAGGSAVVAMSAPEFSGDSATIFVRVLKPYHRGGMYTQVTRLTLRKRDTAWAVDRARVIFVT